MKLYKVIVWGPGEGAIGKRIEIMANGPIEAKAKLQSQYGPGHTFSIHNEEDANRPR